ncbi:hypothetical protein R5R35_013455 [Gryllus longicercus]|uniref:Accessory gland protein n=1 Tax=Gryllus longicercus TaxID=2509291 RepID=A0AAN9YZJ9_9ORTH
MTGPTGSAGSPGARAGALVVFRLASLLAVAAAAGAGSNISILSDQLDFSTRYNSNERPPGGRYPSLPAGGARRDGHRG